MNFKAQSESLEILRQLAPIAGQDEESEHAVLIKLPRRRFLQMTGIAGAGLLLGSVASCGRTTASLSPDGVLSANPLVSIGPDNSVILFSKNPEIGQGVKTALPMIIAEELDVSWVQVQVRQAEIDEDKYGVQYAGGSRSIPSNWQMMREAGASARHMLMAAAAKQWQVEVKSLATCDGYVREKIGTRSASYGELAAAAALLPLPDPKHLKFKSPADYQILGCHIGGVDNPAIVRGEPLFGIDVQLPGMLYAVYEKCPATGGEVRNANLESIKRLPGVKDAFSVKGGRGNSSLMPGVAIVGTSTWAVFSARKQLQVEWDESEASADSWKAALTKISTLTDKSPEQDVLKRGDIKSSKRNAVRSITATYQYGFVSHAQLEPQNCTAHMHDDRLEIWAPTQVPQRARDLAAEVAGIASDNVEIHQMRAGGGFGRRLYSDPVEEVTAIAMRVEAPVKLQWSREDDMQHDFFRAGGAHQMEGHLDAKGRLTGWRNHLISFSADGKKPVSGGGLHPGLFPQSLVDNVHAGQTLLPWRKPCGAWRAPGSNVFGFVYQGFLHELSSAAKRDHLEFLLELMGEPRWLEPGNPHALHTGRAAAVLRRAADQADWGKVIAPGRGLGLAFYFSHAGHFAEVADVSVSADKVLTVNRVTVAADVGPIINRSGAENQCQGSVIDGLSAMMGQEIQIEAGRASPTNFHQYPLLRMTQAPEVDVHFIESDFPPTGMGEPALPPLAPAVANAIFAATGDRIRILPISKAGYRLG